MKWIYLACALCDLLLNGFQWSIVVAAILAWFVLNTGGVINRCHCTLWISSVTTWIECVSCLIHYFNQNYHVIMGDTVTPIPPDRKKRDRVAASLDSTPSPSSAHNPPVFTPKSFSITMESSTEEEVTLRSLDSKLNLVLNTLQIMRSESEAQKDKLEQHNSAIIHLQAKNKVLKRKLIEIEMYSP